ncbi:MAG: dihydrolipoyl dehydrogenase [Metallibacterium scheffleri]|jgi:dihydrolipoamide dehydrogenase|uniref:dihydrolipoyl dehydrogenase n=1 Tax=Metallibacterium scheffleri TaxID=993689 RepID=UPI0026EB91D6|nr:dihydrolipoyl dehydrogenase [Metallibacterium scheffleri]MCK9367825.1 dihydrolipoyl dehydrogenase [Metallibacterium scheffleri]
MASTIEIKVPDIGNYHDVPVIELLVKPGDTVRKDQGLVTLESDKATMEVPAPAAGMVKELKVKLGDAVSEGTLVALIEVAGVGAPPSPAVAGATRPAVAAPAPAAVPVVPPPAPVAAADSGHKADVECALLVLGAGPGGYTAAFRAADLGLDVVLVERYASLGGVCLNVGCIPSKALLHTAEVIAEAEAMAAHGVSFGPPKLDLDKLRGFKDGVVGKLTGGLAGLAKQRKVRVLQGVGMFVAPHELDVQTSAGVKRVRYAQAIVAAGSQALKLPGFPWDDARVMDSTDALALADIPKSLLVVGGGIIGLEMACVYAALGSAVTVVELAEQLMPGCDADLVKPLQQRLSKRLAGIHLRTKVARAAAEKDGIHVVFEGESIPARDVFDRVLVAVGRVPNGKRIGAEAASIAVDARGYIAVDAQMRSNVPHIFAIGDIVGNPMLAHKATHEAKLAAEVAAGEKREWLARVIPSVAYTDPEIAWVGVSEREAKEKNLAIEVARFPWAASGRALGMDRSEGFSKLIFDAQTRRVVGGGIVGVHAGDLIAEVALAIEMGAEAADIGHTIHPHPTLSETVAMAAEIMDGSITDLIPSRKR